DSSIQYLASSIKLRRRRKRKIVRDPSTPAPAFVGLRRGRQDDKKRRGTRLHLIGAVAGSDGLVRVGLSSGRARLDSRNVCLRGAHGFFFGLAGLIQL